MSHERKLNILLIIPNFGLGGAQRSFSKLANWLPEKYKTTVVVFDNAFDNIYLPNTDIKYLGKTSSGNVVSKTMNFFKRKKALKKLKGEIKPAASISFLEGADYLNLSTGSENKIVSVRGSKQYDPHIRGILGWFRKRILIPRFYKKADVIVTASKGLEFEMLKEYPELKTKMVTIPNGYKINSSFERREKGKYFVMGWAGRLSDEKGLLPLIRIFSECYQQDPGFRLLLLGSGSYISVIREECSRLRISCMASKDFKDSFFEDHIVVICDAGDQYENLLKKFSIYVSTSPSEGFPNVIVEAMQVGVPVVSTDCKWGPREILEPEKNYQENLNYPYFASFGILMPLLINDSANKVWINTILHLKASPESLASYSGKGLKRIIEYDENNIKQSWFHTIESLTQA